MNQRRRINKASLGDAARRAPDGWDSARFFELFLSFGTPLRGGPFLTRSLPSCAPEGHNASHWAGIIATGFDVVAGLIRYMSFCYYVSDYEDILEEY